MIVKNMTMLACAASLAATSAWGADRADWLRGTWGINWKPVNLYNGGHEGLSIEPFLNQISHLKTIDYIQVHLGESSIKSPVHMGPHPLLESFWEGDTDANGDPINLVVPRASFGEDPFLEIVKATRAAGMRVMVYVNSSNMLNRVGSSNPDYIPNITERWKAWCDTDPEAQAFIASQPYHTGVWDAATGTYVNAEAQYPNRKYMFCYAEFVLKVYAIRYGALIDGWCFDSGSYMVLNGDNATNGVYEDQMIYNAFAAACHAGNPNAACSFQNSPERDTEELNPFSEATHADDFMFGHPYNGGRDGGSHTIGNPPLYDRNYAHIEKIKETNGNVHSGIDPQTWTWDDEVVGHYDPPMSTTSWNGGNTPALTDAEFNLWNLEAVQYGGAISWGLPLVAKSGTNEQLIAKDWALAQLNGMDAHLMELESPGAPNWSRALTPVPDAASGQAFSRTLVENVDFYDPEGDSVILSLVGAPSWLSISQTSSGVWDLSGTPNETFSTTYQFRLRASDASGSGDRWVELSVAGSGSGEQVLGNSIIQASPNTNYGTNAVATLLSPVQTAPDGLGTYQIAVDVTPMSGGSIQSGVSGGSTTSTSWGIGADFLFKGSDGESVTSIGNARAINTTGSLTPGHFSNFAFELAEINNGQSVGDRVLVTLDGVPASAGGVRLSTNPDTLDLGSASTVAFANGSSATNDKWSIDGIEVSYLIATGQNPDLVAYWALDDGAGAVASDLSGNGHDAAVVNAAWVGGIDGQALDFNGSDSSVTLPTAAFSGIGDQLTIAMWVNGDTANPAKNSVFYAEDSAGGRLLNVHLPWSNGQVYWDVGDGSGYDRIQKLATPAEYEGAWHHWVFTKDATSGVMNIYLDGTLWQSGTGKSKSVGTVAAATLGSNITTDSYNGSIDEVQLYDVALTAAEVEALYLAYAE